MNLKEFKNKALQNAEFRREYEKYDLAFEIGQMILEARILKGLTQQELARLVNTKQPSIARLENGQQLPSLSFLEKIAKALGTDLLAPKFSSTAKKSTVTNVVVDFSFSVKRFCQGVTSTITLMGNGTTKNYLQKI